MRNAPMCTIRGRNRFTGVHLQPLIEMLEAFRKRAIRVVIVLSIASLALFPIADEILQWFQHRTEVPLAAFGIADPFLSLAAISLGSGAVAVLPYAAYQMLASVSEVFPTVTPRSRLGIWAFSILLFFAGVCFCLWITLPYGSRFLLDFQTERVKAVISVRSFASFCLALTLCFGVLFELPLVMMLSAKLKIASASLMASYRRYAVVGILAAAAIVTPTPDILNLLLLAIPLYILFELGIVGMRICEKKPAPYKDPNVIAQTRA